MSFKIVNSDISTVKADAIVFSANTQPVCGDGMDKRIYYMAGPKELMKARKAIGEIKHGDVAYTPAFNLDAKYLIHAVGPVWLGGTADECDVLKSVYLKSLHLAKELDCKSVAVPLISAGFLGFPKYRALEIATEACNEFIENNSVDITLAVSERRDFVLPPKFRRVVDYVDYELENEMRRKALENRSAATKSKSDKEMTKRMQELISHSEKTFQERLFEIIDERGLTAKEVYDDVKISRQAFSKIQCSKDYHPSKFMVVALCLSLKLDIEKSLELFESAGYSLSSSSKQDLVVKACLSEGGYSIREVKDFFEKLNLGSLETIK